MTGNTPCKGSGAEANQRIETGTCGTLHVMGKRFDVEVLDVDEHGVRVSFPSTDRPSEGIPVQLDLTTDEGFVRYRATAGYESQTTHVAGLVLRDPAPCGGELTQRCHCRVPTDLTVQVKAKSHPRRFDAWVLNLSIGGALLRSALESGPGDQLALDLSLPCHGVESIPARVIHTAADEETLGGQLLGVQFEDTRPEVASTIAEYIEHRLPAVH